MQSAGFEYSGMSSTPAVAPAVHHYVVMYDGNHTAAPPLVRGAVWFIADPLLARPGGLKRHMMVPTMRITREFNDATMNEKSVLLLAEATTWQRICVGDNRYVASIAVILGQTDVVATTAHIPDHPRCNIATFFDINGLRTNSAPAGSQITAAIIDGTIANIWVHPAGTTNMVVRPAIDQTYALGFLSSAAVSGDPELMVYFRVIHNAREIAIAVNGAGGAAAGFNNPFLGPIQHQQPPQQQQPPPPQQQPQPQPPPPQQPPAPAAMTAGEQRQVEMRALLDELAGLVRHNYNDRDAMNVRFQRQTNGANQHNESRFVETEIEMLHEAYDEWTAFQDIQGPTTAQVAAVRDRFQRLDGQHVGGYVPQLMVRTFST